MLHLVASSLFIEPARPGIRATLRVVTQEGETLALYLPESVERRLASAARKNLREGDE